VSAIAEGFSTSEMIFFCLERLYCRFNVYIRFVAWLDSITVFYLLLLLIGINEFRVEFERMGRGEVPFSPDQ
jgi:hypothetical protein